MTKPATASLTVQPISTARPTMPDTSRKYSFSIGLRVVYLAAAFGIPFVMEFCAEAFGAALDLSHRLPLWKVRKPTL